MVSGKEGLLFGSYVAVFLLCSHMVEGTRELSGVFFIRAVIPFIGLHPHDLITSPKPLLLIPSLYRLGFQFINFGRTCWEGLGAGGEGDDRG